MPNRREALAALKTVLEEISEIKTVVRTYKEAEFGITQHAQADLPLIIIPEPAEETYEEMTSQHSMMSLLTKLMVYFLDWDTVPDATRQVLELLESGYVDCIATDIGKQVKDDDVEIGELLAYDNTLRKWWIRSASTIVDISVMTITSGTGVGTADGNSVATESLYETLVKKIRNKIGDNFTLNDKATEARIMSVSSVLGTMPIYNFVVEMEMKYYLDETAT